MRTGQTQQSADNVVTTTTHTMLLSRGKSFGGEMVYLVWPHTNRCDGGEDDLGLDRLCGKCVLLLLNLFGIFDETEVDGGDDLLVGVQQLEGACGVVCGVRCVNEMGTSTLRCQNRYFVSIKSRPHSECNITSIPGRSGGVFAKMQWVIPGALSIWWCVAI